MQNARDLQNKIRIALNKYGVLPLDLLANHLYKKISQESAIARTKRLMNKLLDNGSIIIHQVRGPRRSFVTFIEMGANDWGYYWVEEEPLTKNQMPSEHRTWCNLMAIKMIEDTRRSGQTYLYSQKEILAGLAPGCRFGFRMPHILELETFPNDTDEGVLSYATWMELYDAELEDAAMTSLVDWIILTRAVKTFDGRRQKLFFADAASCNGPLGVPKNEDQTGQIFLQSVRFILVKPQAELLPSRLYNELEKRIGVKSTKEIGEHLQFYIPGKTLQHGFAIENIPKLYSRP